MFITENLPMGYAYLCPGALYMFVNITGLRPIYMMFFKFLLIRFQMKNNDDMLH